MAQIQHINPDCLGNPTNFGFNTVVIPPPSSTLIFIAGQGGREEQGYLADDFETQLKQAFANLQTALATAGAAPEHVVKITVLSVNHDAEKQALISRERNVMWPDNLGKPASTLIPVPRLAGDGMLVEMDAIAAIPTASDSP